ncbi:hypothetical protein Leryth_016471, partial [Lithospermum erythrorhizon]
MVSNFHRKENTYKAVKVVLSGSSFIDHEFEPLCAYQLHRFLFRKLLRQIQIQHFKTKLKL